MTLAQELEKLLDLRERGALTEFEFTQAKTQLLHPDKPFPYSKFIEPETQKGSFDPKQQTADLKQMARQLARSTRDRVVGGVCGGLADMAHMPAWIMRVIFTLSTFYFFTGLIVYIVLWIFMPGEDHSEAETDLA